MAELFSLPITYKGKEMEFPFKVVAHGYITRYVIEVEGVEVVYERDDSGELRAVIYNQEQLTAKLPERELLQAIHEVMEHLLG